MKTIEQKAHEYADNFNSSKMAIEWQASYRGYLEGAKELQKENEELKSRLKFYDDISDIASKALGYGAKPPEPDKP